MALRVEPTLSSSLKAGPPARGEIDNVIVDLQTKLRRFKEAFAVEMLERIRRRNQYGPDQRYKTGAMTRGWGYTMKALAIELWNVRDYSWYQEFGTKYIRPAGFIRRAMEEAEQIADVAKQRVGLKD